MRTNRCLTLVHACRLARPVAVAALVAAALATCGQSASAQLPQNRLYAIYPLGGQAGAEVVVTITNSADGDEVDGLYFSHPGITAVQTTQVVNGREEPVANQFRVTIDDKVPPGIYDVRSTGLFGISNPRSFVVGARKELQESEGNNTPDAAGAIELGAVVNGRSNAAGDIDFYKFPATKGQRLIVECLAERIDSRMDATLELYDPTGRRVAFSRNEHRGDPLIDYTAETDGDYMLRVYDFLYEGNNDYFYRVAVHAGPHIEYIFPPAGVPNTTGDFVLYGQNLPGGEPSGVKLHDRELDKLAVKIPIPADATALQPGTYLQPYEAEIDGFTYRLQTPQGPTNPVLIQFARSAVQIEQEPNNDAPQSTKITVPGDVAGQFQARNDIDYFQFDAKANQVFWIEVYGQRAGTFADPLMIVEQITVDKEGKESVKRLTAQDDDGTNLGAQSFDTRTDDPVFRFAAPADGTYRIQLRDRYFENRGDPRMVYRISIRPEEPDFRLVALPRQPVLAANVAALPATWDVSLRKGDHTEIEVLAFRKNGFAGAIDVSVAGLPAGVTCPGATIGPGQNSARLLLTSTEDAADWVGPIQIIGKVHLDDPAALKAEQDARKALDTAADGLPVAQTAASTAAAAVKAAETALQAQVKQADTAAAQAKQMADAAAAAKKKLAEADAALQGAQKSAAEAANMLETASAAFVDSAVKKATADRNADDAARAATQAVEAKLAAQQAKDAAAEAEADKRIVAAAVAAKLAADAKVAAATAFDTAVTGKETATAQKANADKAAAAATEVQKQAANAYAAAAKSAEEAAAVAKKETEAKTAAEQALAQANEKAQQATAAAQEAEKQLAAAEAAWKTAAEQRTAKASQLTRVARGGTIVWSGNQTLTASSRVARNITLSVLKEAAPYQIEATTPEAVVSQGAQLLIPVKLTKRSGFDNKVDLTFEDVPKNIDAEKKAIEKGQTEQLVRLFVKDNVAPGKYTIYVRGQGELEYVRNPEGLKRAEEEKQAATQAAAAAAELVKTTTEAKTAADKQAADAQTAATKAGEALVAADVAVTAAKQAVEVATLEKTTVENAETDAAAKEAAAKKLADAQTALTKAETEKATAAQQAAAAAESLKQAQAAKNKADVAAAEAAAKSTTAEAIKKAAEAKAEAAAKAAKPAKVNVFAPSNAITFEVRPAPVTVKLNVPDKGALKRGGEIKIGVKVDRKNGFAGPVTLSLPLPPGVSGLAAAPVTIAADKTDAEFVIKASGEATEGKLANLVVRAGMNFLGKTYVDAPVEITVSK